MNQYLDLFLDIGQSMLEAGAEIHRVEDTIHRLCRAYDLERAEVFAIRALIVVTVKGGTGESFTESRRIYRVGINMARLEDLNSLSRYICGEKPDLEEISLRLRECMEKKELHRWETAAGYILAASTFACFFGGRLGDGVVAGILGGLLFEIDSRVGSLNPQKLVYTAACSMILGFCGMAWGLLVPEARSSKIMIGTIMLLIPGMAFMNSVRDMLNNNAMTGFFSLVDAVLTAGSIAAGFAVPLILMGGR